MIFSCKNCWLRAKGLPQSYLSLPHALGVHRFDCLSNPFRRKPASEHAEGGLFVFRSEGPREGHVWRMHWFLFLWPGFSKKMSLSLLPWRSRCLAWREPTGRRRWEWTTHLTDNLFWIRLVCLRLHLATACHMFEGLTWSKKGIFSATERINKEQYLLVPVFKAIFLFFLSFLPKNSLMTTLICL